MNLVLIIGAGVAILIATLLAIAATRPNEMKIERSASIAAPAEAVFALINDFREWGKWSPWEKLDPAMTKTFSDVSAGMGASYAWEGNKKVGKGRMEITKATPSSEVVLDLHFMAPWEARNQTSFTLQPDAEGTRVTWTMTGTNNFMFKLMGLFMNMDDLVGKDFESGLAAMKQAAEARA